MICKKMRDWREHMWHQSIMHLPGSDVRAAPSPFVIVMGNLIELGSLCGPRRGRSRVLLSHLSTLFSLRLPLTLSFFLGTFVPFLRLCLPNKTILPLVYFHCVYVFFLNLFIPCIHFFLSYTCFNLVCVLSKKNLLLHLHELGSKNMFPLKNRVTFFYFW